MTTPFKDHFSGHSAFYAEFRPTYPDALFAYLRSLCSGNDLAWDCATGSGQSACALAAHFGRVHATDASDAQIANAMACKGVSYSVAQAENSGLNDESVDLITVAQALHWFEFDPFFDEAHRVLKPGGLLAIWCYQDCAVDAGVNQIIAKLKDVVEDYWAPERDIVEDGYENIVLPFRGLDVEDFAMHKSWRATDLLSYMRTWSASQRFTRENGTDPMQVFADELTRCWGRGRRDVSWPLILKVRRK